MSAPVWILRSPRQEYPRADGSTRALYWYSEDLAWTENRALATRCSSYHRAATLMARTHGPPDARIVRLVSKGAP